MARASITTTRERRIARALGAIERRFGSDVARRLRERAPSVASSAVPSGSLGLDLATGTSGFPRGRLTELLGVETSGKTSLLFGAIAATQRQGGLVALIDAEDSADPEALAACGVDLRELLVVRPDSAADALAILTILARCGGPDLLALASLAALRDFPIGTGPAAQGEQRPYELARLVSRWLRSLMAALPGEATAVVVTNEWLSHLPGHRTPGGLALRHYAALRVAVEPLARLPEGVDGADGMRVGLTVIKSKVGVPGGRAEVDLRVGSGVDGAGEILVLGLAAGLIARGPLGWSFGTEPLGRGVGAARRQLTADSALAGALAAAIVASRARPAAG